MLDAALWKCSTQKIAKNSPSGHHRTTLSGYIFANKEGDRQSEKLVEQQYLPTCPHNTVNFSLLAAEIVSLVWGTLANLNGFRVLAVLLHGTLVVGVSQTLRRWTEGATYIGQGGHHVGYLSEDVEDKKAVISQGTIAR